MASTERRMQMRRRGRWDNGTFSPGRRARRVTPRRAYTGAGALRLPLGGLQTDSACPVSHYSSVDTSQQYTEGLSLARGRRRRIIVITRDPGSLAQSTYHTNLPVYVISSPRRRTVGFDAMSCW